MTFRVVIPARYASSRLPGKPLIDLGGKPMIVRVVEQALRSAAQSVVVATDDERVASAVQGSGAVALMTRADHATGSDRVMEAVRICGWGGDDVVVNVQGDEPLIPPPVIDQVAALLRTPSTGANACPVATLCEPISRVADVFDPNVVKVVADDAGRALYFSRAPLPWAREAFANGQLERLGPHWRRHIGIYAYRVSALEAFVAWPPSALEQVEVLEQLRLLEHGVDIAVAEAVTPVPGGVDTPADVERVLAALAG